MDAEAEGAYQASQLVQKIKDKYPEATEARYYLDNSSVVAGLVGNSPNSSFRAFQLFKRNAKTLGVTSFVSWVPSHQGIPGNERADVLAKTGAAKTPRRRDPSYSYLRKKSKEEQAALFRQYWDRERQKLARYRLLDVTATSHPKELSLTRQSLRTLLAERTEHGDFVSYHQRFLHVDYTPDCQCGAPKEPGHFASCKYTDLSMAKIPRGADPALFLLGQEGVQYWGELATKRNARLASARRPMTVSPARPDQDPPSPPSNRTAPNSAVLGEPSLHTGA